MFNTATLPATLPASKAALRAAVRAACATYAARGGRTTLCPPARARGALRACVGHMR